MSVSQLSFLTEDNMGSIPKLDNWIWIIPSFQHYCEAWWNSLEILPKWKTLTILALYKNELESGPFQDSHTIAQHSEIHKIKVKSNLVTKCQTKMDLSFQRSALFVRRRSQTFYCTLNPERNAFSKWINIYLKSGRSWQENKEKIPN